MKIEEMLNEEIEAELGTLSKMTDVGSDSYKAAVDSIAKLTDRAIEFEKIKAAKAEAELKQKAEAEQKQKELDDKKKDRIVNTVVAGASIGLPLAVTIWGTCKSFEFEKEGSITTLVGRGFINKLLKK